jgi:ABC-type Fe3+-hydroxamate transport system substrate-binding protein
MNGGAEVRRVVSLVPSMTETVCLLGAQQRLVAVTRFCTEPEGALRDVPRVGGTKNPKLEKIALLQPDLVLVNGEENRAEDIAWLRARVPVLQHEPRSVTEAASAIRDVARALGLAQEAVPWLVRIEAQVTRARVEQLSLGEVRVFYAIWKKPWMGVNRDTYIHDVLSRAGAVNVCAEEGARYPEVKPEELRERGVQLVLLSSEPFPFTEADRVEVETAKAFGTAPVLLCDGRDFCWHGVRTADGLGRALDLLQPFRPPR